jgi:hypothetical protein
MEIEMETTERLDTMKIMREAGLPMGNTDAEARQRVAFCMDQLRAIVDGAIARKAASETIANQSQDTNNGDIELGTFL